MLLFWRGKLLQREVVPLRSAAAVNVGQGRPASSLPSATRLLSCLIQWKLACRGLFCHRTPKLTKSALFVPALTHSGVWNAQQRACRVNTDAGTLSELQIKTALSSACVYELSALVLTPLLWRHDSLSLQRFLPSSPLPPLSRSLNTFSCDWRVNFCLIWKVYEHTDGCNGAGFHDK